MGVGIRIPTPTWNLLELAQFQILHEDRGIHCLLFSSSPLPGRSSVSATSSAPPSSATLVPAAAAAATDESSSSSECEAEDSSSPVSDMESLDFTEAPWDESESFFLHKYPSYEIDWDSILSQN